MKIQSSIVAMASERRYSSSTISAVSRTVRQVEPDPMDKVTEKKDAAAADKKARGEAAKANVAASIEEAMERKKTAEDMLLARARDRLCGETKLATLPPDKELTLIELILQALDGDEESGHRVSETCAEARASSQHSREVSVGINGGAVKAYSAMKQFSSTSMAIAARSVRVNGQSAKLVPAVEYDYRSVAIRSESEHTDFSAKGVAITEDGREIAFNVDVCMSRQFSMTTSFAISDSLGRKLLDPLVINVGADVAQISDQKFMFDLDADGTEDNISRLGHGSGFLALDKNGDGAINDGSELFGAMTGDGFGELAQYDDDGNGWIDENDAVFGNLRVWYMAEDGTQRLVGLIQSDVGAIYLGNAETQFSVNDGFNRTDAVVRKSGVFLKENGGVGTVQHVDFAL